MKENSSFYIASSILTIGRCEFYYLYTNSGKRPCMASGEYAENMGIGLGDTIAVGEKEYTVAGDFQRPDYLYMLQNPEDAYKNITAFFLCYLSDHKFESLGAANCQYLVKYTKDNRRIVLNVHHILLTICSYFGNSAQN